MRTKKVNVSIPEYLYLESMRITDAGLFTNFSELVRAGIRRELMEVSNLIQPQKVKVSWDKGLNRLRKQVQEKRSKGYGKKRTEEETIKELRGIRKEIWEQEYR